MAGRGFKSAPERAREVGARLAEMREARGMRQADLCRAAGVPSSLLTVYESGKRDIPRERAIDLVLALRGSLDYLFLGTFASLPADLAAAILERRRKS